MRSVLIFLCSSHWGFLDPLHPSLSLSHTHTHREMDAHSGGLDFCCRNSIVQTCLTTITLYHSQIFLRKHQLWLCTFSSNMYSLALPNKGGTLKWCRVHLVPHFGGYSPGGGTLWTIRSFLGAVTKHSSPGGTVWTVSLVFGNFCGTFLTF
jgi:pantothenate kinase